MVTRICENLLRKRRSQIEDKFRLYWRKDEGFYAEECATARRESLGTKNEVEVCHLITEKNQTASQPAFSLRWRRFISRPMIRSFVSHTWSLVSNAVQ